jgi:hypothetical protein
MNDLWHLLEKIPETDACIPWEHCRLPKIGADRADYGQVRYGGKVWLVHRLTWTLHRGPIPEGMDVCHSCDSPPCFNLRHLFLGTRQENMQDCATKGRNFIPKGEIHPRARLTEAQVIDIRTNLYKPHTRGSGAKSLAKRFGVSIRAMRMVISGETWRHL